MMSESSRGSLLFNITLTELAFLLFLILLTIIFVSYAETKEELNRTTKELADKNTSDSENSIKLVLQEKVIEDLKESSNWDDPDKAFNTLVQNKKLSEEYDTVKKEIEKLKKSEQSLVEATEMMKDNNKDLTGMVGYLTDKCLNAKGGNDYPPCWVNQETTKVEYLYTITLNEDDVFVERAWPDSRIESVERMGIIQELVDNTLPLNEFMKQTKPVYNWSVNNKCRHYVIIEDRAITKKSFKTKLFAIETHFYKYISKTSDASTTN